MALPDNPPPTLVYGVGLCYASACTLESDDRALIALNREAGPAGTSHGWQIADEPFADGSPNPSPCPDDPARRHVLFAC